MDPPQMADRLHDVAGAGFPFGSDQRGTLANPPESLSEVPRPAYERDDKVPLVYVVLFIGGRQDFALVDEVDLHGFQHPRLGDMADPALGHDRDADGLLNLADLA